VSTALRANVRSGTAKVPVRLLPPLPAGRKASAMTHRPPEQPPRRRLATPVAIALVAAIASVAAAVGCEPSTQERHNNGVTPQPVYDRSSSESGLDGEDH
jgi:hypothetical protein